MFGPLTYITRLLKFKLRKYLLASAILVCVFICTYIYINLNKTVEEFAYSLLYDKMEQTRSKLDNFFDPVKSNMSITYRRASNNTFERYSLEQLDQHFLPLLEDCVPVSSMMLARSDGKEFMMLDLDSIVVNRVCSNQNDTLKSTMYEWDKVDHKLHLKRKYIEDQGYDCRKRPWFKAAINDEKERAQWTDPYTFFITKDPGITVSRRWTDSNNVHHVVAFDLMLWDISRYTTNLQIKEHGSVFVLTEDGRVLGLPNWDKYKNDTQAMRFDVLKHASEFKNNVISEAFKIWKKETNNSDYFSFDYEDEKWRGVMVPYLLGNQKLFIGVVAPEKDFLVQVKYTKWIILIGIAVLAFFMIILFLAYRKMGSMNGKLKEKNKIIEEKSGEIKDSISYAKRIQNALLPSGQLFRTYFPNSFVYYKPKDIVAGDFYWVHQIKNEDGTATNSLLIAVADCTGHGVPGAMVSVVCNNALNRAVREFDLTHPNEILDITRVIVLQEFEQSKNEVNDGMDISMVHLEVPVKMNGKENFKIQFSGAHNPLWVIREGSEHVEVYRGDKQPVGNYMDPKPFQLQELSLSSGDTIYLFSDGYTDQFGGPKGKKYKATKFKSFLLSIQDLPMSEQREQLAIEMKEWQRDMEQIDDICVVGIRL